MPERICSPHPTTYPRPSAHHEWSDGEYKARFFVSVGLLVPECNVDFCFPKNSVDGQAVYNFARRLKTLSGLTPDEYFCKIWTSERQRFILNPIHQMPRLNT